MNQKELFEFHDEFCEKAKALVKIKNADYTGQSDNPFKNFELIEVFNVASTEVGMFTRLLDKFARISTFITVGVLRVKDESVDDALLDLSNYAMLLAAVIESRRRAMRKT